MEWRFKNQIPYNKVIATIFTFCAAFVIIISCNKNPGFQFPTEPENPLIDSRFTTWPSGDTYLVYPGAHSSVRFERVREGIQDYEKIRILREELAESSSPGAAIALERLEGFLGSVDSKTLHKHSAAEVINKGKQLVNEIAGSQLWTE